MDRQDRQDKCQNRSGFTGSTGLSRIRNQEQIDLTHVPAGVHRLSVTVKDFHNDEVVSRDALFRVIE